MTLFTLVPVKTDTRAKTRLAATLSVEARGALMRRLLRCCLAALVDADAPNVRVVTRNPDAVDIAEGFGFQAYPDEAEGPNQSAAAAARLAAAEGASLVAVIAADLPLVTGDDVRRLLGAGARDTGARDTGARDTGARDTGPRDTGARGRVAIAPDRLGLGTNCLVTPPGFPYAFGPNSFRHHSQSARDLGYRLRVVRSPGLAVDIDQPFDLDLAPSADLAPSFAGPQGPR